MRARRWAAATSLVAVALSGCGGSGTSSSQTTATPATPPSPAGSTVVTPPPGTPAALRGAHGAVLAAGELPGFDQQGYQPPSTSAKSFVAEFPPDQRAAEAARLEALGFVAAIEERLAPKQVGGANGEAISLVEQYRSAHGAGGEVAAQLKQALGRGESAFAVAGIPGARGWAFTKAGTPDANVAFAVGAYYYLIGFSAGGPGAPTHSQLVTAAQRLYRRVRG